MMPFPPTDSAQDWLAYLRRQGKSPHTIRAYEQGLRHFTHWYTTIYSAPFALAEVMPRDVMVIQKSEKGGRKAAKSSRLGRMGGDETEPNDQEQEPR